MKVLSLGLAVMFMVVSVAPKAFAERNTNEIISDLEHSIVLIKEGKASEPSLDTIADEITSRQTLPGAKLIEALLRHMNPGTRDRGHNTEAIYLKISSTMEEILFRIADAHPQIRPIVEQDVFEVLKLDIASLDTLYVARLSQLLAGIYVRDWQQKDEDYESPRTERVLREILEEPLSLAAQVVSRVLGPHEIQAIDEELVFDASNIRIISQELEKGQGLNRGTVTSDLERLLKSDNPKAVRFALDQIQRIIKAKIAGVLSRSTLNALNKLEVGHDSDNDNEWQAKLSDRFDPETAPEIRSELHDLFHKLAANPELLHDDVDVYHGDRLRKVAQEVRLAIRLKQPLSEELASEIRKRLTPGQFFPLYDQDSRIISEAVSLYELVMKNHVQVATIESGQPKVVSAISYFSDLYVQALSLVTDSRLKVRLIALRAEICDHDMDSIGHKETGS